MITRQLLQAAREQVSEVTGHPVESITGLRRNDDGWVIDVEVRELERVPNTMDLLATYEVHVTEDGDVTGFERRRRYHRAAVDDGRS